AEDGIRDKLVTGVQTCALPICNEPAGALDGPCLIAQWLVEQHDTDHRANAALSVHCNGDGPTGRYCRRRGFEFHGRVLVHLLGQIGRASCRERVWMSVAAILFK